MEESIFSTIVTKEMAMLAAGAIALMVAIGRIPLKDGKRKLNESLAWKNWGSFILVALCLAGAFAPGVSNIAYKEWGSIVIFGLVASMVAHLGRKILAPIILSRLEGKSAPKE